MQDQDDSVNLQNAITQAQKNNTPLSIVGGNSKAFYGRQVEPGQPLSTQAHTGIIDYRPSELMLQVRSGTPLAQIETLLAAENQMLAFEPPYFGRNSATIGGAIATGLAGARRPWGGAPRDSLLGVQLIDGLGRKLTFGGQVMKNVAGYDLTRLMAGSLGTLGLLLDVSLKTLPKPEIDVTLSFEWEREEALAKMRTWFRQPVPLSGACYFDDRLFLRLSGNSAGVSAWQKSLGGERLAHDKAFWSDLRDHTLSFFQNTDQIWRLSVPASAPALPVENGQSLLDWAGSQRWIRQNSAADIFAQAQQAGGHAQLFRGAKSEEDVFSPLDPIQRRWHQKIKAQFDPQKIFNPGRLYRDL